MTTTVQDSNRSAPLLRASRCLQLRPSLDQFRLDPIVIGVGRVVLGSGAQADVELPVEGIAEEHCAIEFDGAAARVSVRNPLTWLNDGPIREGELAAGDLLTIGPLELKVSYLTVPPPPPLPPSGPSNPAAPPRSNVADAPALPEAAPIPGERFAEHRPSLPSAPAFVESSVDPLLDDALAHKRLRHDLERMEREAAWFRAHAAPEQIALPALDLTDCVPPAEVDGSDHSTRFPHIHSATFAQNGQARPVRPHRRSDSRPSASALDHAEDWRSSVQPADRLASSPAPADVRGFRAPAPAPGREQIDVERERLAKLQQTLEQERRSIEEQRRTLIAREQEFDAAVAALDEDRRQWETQRKSVEHELRNRERQAHQTQSRVRQEVEELGDREAELTRLAESLAQRAAALDDRSVEQRQHEEQLRSEWESFQRELANHQANWEAREAELVQRAEELDQQAEELDRRDAQLAESADRLAAERAELEARREELTSAQSEIEQALDEIEQNRRELKELHHSLSDQAAQLETEREQLGSRRKDLDDAAGILAKQRSEIAARETAAQALERELKVQEREIRQREHSLNEAQSEFERGAEQAERLAESRNSELATAALKLQKEQKRLEALRQELEEGRREIESESTRLTAWAEKLDAIEVELAQRVAEPAESNPTPPEADVNVAEMRQQFEELAEELQRQRAALAESEAALLAEQREGAVRREQWAAEVEELRSSLATPAPDTGPEPIDEQALEDLKLDLARTQEERDELRSELAKLHETHAGIDEEFQWLQAEAARADADRGELLDRQNEVARQEHELDDHRRRLEARAQELDVEAQELESARLRLIELQRLAENASPVQAAEAPVQERGPAADQEQAVREADFEDRQAPCEPSHLQPDHRPHVQQQAAQVDDAVERSAAPAGRSPDSKGIRSQLAALFGIAPETLEETAARHSADEPAQPVPEECGDEQRLAPVDGASSAAPEQDGEAGAIQSTASEGDAPASEDSEAARYDDSPLESPFDGDDHVADYMQRLLARTREMESAPQPVAASVARETAVPPPAHEPLDEQTPELADSTDASANGRAGRARRLDRQELAELRANIDSMRQIANLSARSAVAQHYSKKLAITYQVKLILTVVGAGLSLMLLTAEFWTDNSYRWPGTCALMVTLISSLELARTTIQMRRVKKIVSTAAAAAEAGEDEEARADEIEPA